MVREEVMSYRSEEWVKGTGGYSHVPQQVPWQNILNWQVEMFLYSCYLYYDMDNPKLTDEQFDNIVDLMERHYDELPDRIKNVCGKGQIKANAHFFANDLSDEEKENAILWRNKDQ